VLLKIVAFAAVLLTSLVVGVLWGTWLSLSRSIETFSVEMFLEIGHRMIKNLAVPMRFLMACMLFVNTSLCYLLFHEGHRIAGLLTAFGLLFLVGVVIFTVALNVPIDLQIKKWKPDNLPADWQEIRQRWKWFHELRTMLSLAGLCLIIAGIFTLI
jgi:uncharacterized membrane protein